MKHRIFTYCLPVALAGALVLSGCDSSVNEDGTAMIGFQLDGVFGTTAITNNAATVYDLNGRNITLTAARFYMSEITLLKSDGSEVALKSSNPITVPARDQSGSDVSHTVDDMIVLTRHDLGTNDYPLGEVEAGSYSGIRFKLGIDGLTNRVDATQVPASHPLAKQTDRNNHWSWNSGYIFLRMDGTVDADGDGTTESNWETHIGTPNYLTTVQLNHDFELGDGDMADIHVIVDYATFIEDVDFSNSAEHLCHTMDNPAVAQKVGANMAGAFEFHGLHQH